MNFGRLWYDADPNKSLGQKVLEAAENYYEKQGAYPNTAYVHPSMLEGIEFTSIDGRISIYPADYVTPNNIWIGWEE